MSRRGCGWQYDIRDGAKVETCAPCQIKFVRDRKNVDGDFRTLVRMTKKWRNWAELKPLKSFAIELIMAYLLDTRGEGDSIEQRFRDFLLYLAQSGLKEVISPPRTDGGAAAGGPWGPERRLRISPCQSSAEVWTLCTTR